MSDMTERALYEVFAQAIEAERKAGDLYQRAATMCGHDTELASMFKRLAQQEREHESELFGAYGIFKKTLQANVAESSPPRHQVG